MTAQESEYVKGCYLGGPGSFTEAAFDSFFFSHMSVDHQKVKKTGIQDIEQVFQAVEKNEYRFGCIPLENSTSGLLEQTFDCLVKYKVNIVADWVNKDDYCLCVSPGMKKENIKTVRTHYNFFKACGKFLKNSLPNAKKVIATHTSEAAKIVMNSEDKTKACIISKNCAKLNKLEVLETGIGDDLNSQTRYILISKTPCDLHSTGLCRLKCMISLTMRNKASSLFKCFSVFAFRDINIDALHSRPLLKNEEKHFQYRTFLEFQVDDEKEIEKILNDLKNWCTNADLCGAYPCHITNTKAEIESDIKTITM